MLKIANIKFHDHSFGLLFYLLLMIPCEIGSVILPGGEIVLHHEGNDGGDVEMLGVGELKMKLGSPHRHR